VIHYLKMNLNYLLLFEMITIISIVVQVISLLCFFFVPKYKPAEWNIPVNNFIFFNNKNNVFFHIFY
jgi:hypothetical protein